MIAMKNSKVCMGFFLAGLVGGALLCAAFVHRFATPMRSHPETGEKDVDIEDHSGVLSEVLRLAPPHFGMEAKVQYEIKYLALESLPAEYRPAVYHYLLEIGHSFGEEESDLTLILIESDWNLDGQPDVGVAAQTFCGNRCCQVGMYVGTPSGGWRFVGMMSFSTEYPPWAVKLTDGTNYLVIDTECSPREPWRSIYRMDLLEGLIPIAEIPLSEEEDSL